MKNVISIFCLICLQAAFCKSAQAMDYFDAPINYWNEQPKVKTQTEIIAPIKVGPEKSKFEWKKYLDPSNDEFFREGDYTPPKPFMEVARNPTNENLKNWFEYMQAKNELAARLQIRMQEYMQGKTVATSGPQPMTQTPKTQTVKVDSSRFKFRMYFDSHCPHCKRMFETLAQLQADGFSVEALQVDDGPLFNRPGSITIARAEPTDTKKHKIESVPHVIVADLKRQALLPAIKGYQSYEDVVDLLRKVN